MFNASQLTPAHVDALLSPRNGGTIRGEDAIAPGAVANVIQAHLAANGYREYVDYEGNGHVYRVIAEETVKVPWREFVADVSGALMALLEAVLATAPTGARARRATGTRAVLTSAERGATTYLRAVARDVRERLPELSEEEHKAAEDAAREARKAARSVVVEDPAAVRVARSSREANRRDEDKAQVRDLLGKWAAGLPSGRHVIGDVWAAWRRAIEAPRTYQKLREQKHGALRVGRTAFYALLEETGNVVNGGARKRYLVVP
ncbi:hypothetical protein NCCP1664_25120 [Zafaria cholistanensis]|uniref:Uncharacterized protein n=1 Tax=Zafaria cholistanensis TaxID=1682741 RepID=A0A5A7NV88_9MICC|nr:hypothetical protein [Zafaria cholistanensis]GER24017.1 hypothetical protein NCCP1664_25120 [Zafaria cholistanensis]